jgi:hypothetical protein
MMIVNKETIQSYFSEYGVIEDIIINDDLHKAYILFKDPKSVNSVLNDNQNKVLSKLFKMKKFSNRTEENININTNFNKFTVLDTEALNNIRNFKLMKNIEFMKNQEKKKSIEFENKKEEENTNINSNTSTVGNFADFESAILNKLKNTFEH